MARSKDYQFVDLRLLSYEEVKSDLIFVKPILEACGVDIEDKELERCFLNLQKQFLNENNIDSHEKLVNFLSKGGEAYYTLKGLETNKGIENGDYHSIEKMLKDREITEQMANQIEQQICHQKTDLHTHLNAILPSNQLIQLAKECNIDVNKIENTLDMQENGTFSDMQEVYRKRNNIIIKKLIENGYGEKFLEEIAKDYKEHGIYYTEITTDAKILQMIVKRNINIDKIEANTGVKLRFLLQIHRSDSGAENKQKFTSDEIQNLMINSKYIKGIDICGQETDGFELKNQELFLECVTDYASQNPNFIIRLHSGETQKDPNGIKDALEIIKAYCDSFNENYPQIRIGHAIHGINEESIKLIKDMGASIELNLASNLRLINLHQRELLEDRDLVNTIEMCKKNNIPIFLGTDGYGLYSSAPEEQMILAKQVGIDVLRILREDSKYIEYQERENNKRRTKLPKKSPEKRKIERRIEKGLGIEAISNKSDIFKDKIPIIIAGGSLKTRGNIDFEEYKNIAIAFQTLINNVDPEKMFFVTGGTNCGPERFLHEAIQRRNNRDTSKKIDCLGAIPLCIGKDDDNARQDFRKIQERTITHGLIVDAFKTWGQFPMQLLKIANNKLISIKDNGIRNICGRWRCSKR